MSQPFLFLYTIHYLTTSEFLKVYSRENCSFMPNKLQFYAEKLSLALAENIKKMQYYD